MTNIQEMCKINELLLDYRERDKSYLMLYLICTTAYLGNNCFFLCVIGELKCDLWGLEMRRLSGID